MHNRYISTFPTLWPLLFRGLSTSYAEPIPRQNRPQVQGYVDPKFEQIRTSFQSYLDSGAELGSSLCININGTDVVNLWGGYADINKTKTWNQDTLVNVYSTGKMLVSLAALTLVERGQLDVNERVSKYWPEFAINGKQDILVRHLMSHTAGLAAWEANMTVEDVYNTTYAAAKLGEQHALWEQRNVSGYHAVTYGFPIGELIRRITGKPTKQFIAEEIAGPLKADFSIGVPEKDWYRVAELLEGKGIPAPDDDPNSISLRAFINPPLPVSLTKTAGWRNAEIGASNGHASASGVVKAMSVITLGGEVDGIKLLSPETINLIFQDQANGTDLVLRFPITFGIGYGLVREYTSGLTNGTIPKDEQRVAYWGGMGGSMGFMDLDKKVTFGYVMNKMRDDLVGSETFQNYAKILYEVLKSQ